jgi:2-succinyl-6-hydroxy-2,4-cyclohexadiene-1-carboxylate synthase
MATADRPTCVLLHGFTHTGRSWAPVIDRLGGRYDSIACDIRGHGDAADAVPADLEHVISDVEQLAPTRFALVGYSMGGRIALHAALALGPRIERLVLIGASPGIADAGERAQRRAADERLADEIEQSTIEQFSASWARTPVLSGQPPEVLAAVQVDRLRNRPAGLARALRGLGAGALPSIWSALGEIAAPTTLVVGERDEKFTAVAWAMAAQIPDAEIVVVPGAGHAVHLEAPAQIAEIIAEPDTQRGR